MPIMPALRWTTLLLLTLVPSLWTLWALAQSPPVGPTVSDEQRYIVRLRDSVVSASAVSKELAQAHGLRLGRTYTHAFPGFSARMTPAAATALRRHPLVATVEADQVVRIDAINAAAGGVQTAAPWGLDRIDQRDLPLDTTYRFERSGQGVRVHVVDTGILSSHSEFAGRVAPGHDLVADGYGTNDCNGHGTHVAGTIGGLRWGVAKDVTLVPVRVLDCQGSGLLSTVLAGLDLVAADTLRPAVVNLSVSSRRSELFNAAVATLEARGLTVVVAAGNSASDACLMSPASAPTALTVGASTSLDERASWSNRGPCVDLYAPGSGIVSAWHTATDAAAMLSGTSMAAPHASGVAALALAANPAATPGEVRRFVTEQATRDVVRDGDLAGDPAARAALLYAPPTGAPSARTVGIAALVVQPSTAGSDGRIRAHVAAVVAGHDGKGWTEGIAGATVRGRFQFGGLAACTTDAQGRCTLSGCTVQRPADAGTFTVLSIVGDGLAEDPGLGARTVIAPQ